MPTPDELRTAFGEAGLRISEEHLQALASGELVEFSPEDLAVSVASDDDDCKCPDGFILVNIWKIKMCVRPWPFAMQTPDC